MNSIILLIAVIYIICANSFFGNNWLPQSEAEVIADGIGCLLIALAFINPK